MSALNPTEDIFPSLIASIQQAMPDLLALYLYGSMAGGQTRPGSDLDLACLASTPIHGSVLWDQSLQLQQLCDRSVHFIDLRQAPPILAAEVLQHGKQLWLAPKAGFKAAMFETTALASYCDWKEDTASLIDDIRRRGTVYA